MGMPALHRASGRTSLSTSAEKSAGRGYIRLDRRDNHAKHKMKWRPTVLAENQADTGTAGLVSRGWEALFSADHPWPGPEGVRRWAHSLRV